MIDIFIRTYHKDLEWLAYCLRSIHKYCTGYRNIIVCIPEQQKFHLDKMNLTAEKQVYCRSYFNDYVGQQVTKLSSFQYTDAEYILFVDSDCMFNAPCNISEFFFKESLPILYGRPFENLGDAMCWKSPTEWSLRETVQWETMCRFPMIHRRSVVEDCFNLLTINGAMKELEKAPQGFLFSEFNTMGNFAIKYHSDKYHFVDVTKEQVPPPIVNQGWSWGPLDKQKLEAVLG